MKIMNKAMEIAASIKKRGLVNTIIIIVNRAIRAPADLVFDLRYGVNTTGIVGTAGLDVDEKRRQKANHYEPTPALAASTLLGQLGIDYNEYTFIDIGSGKGRLLLLASFYSFKEIVGVEFSCNLHNIAQDNIAKWEAKRGKRGEMRSICADALNYVLPSSPLVIFLFTPFVKELAEKIINNIRLDWEANHRSILVVYYGTNIDFVNLLERNGFSGGEVYAHRPFAALKPYKGYIFKLS